MAVGSIALIVSLSGVAGWIRVGLRNLRHLERLMLGTARAQFAGAAAAISADTDSAQEADSSALVVLSQSRAGATLVHRADCLLVAGKAVRAVSSGDAALEACGMCTP
jgi:fructose-1-phosphate kinase PfkB-like protein